MSRVKKAFLVLLAVFVLLAAMIFSGTLYQTYIKIRSLPMIEAPTDFGLSFDTEAQIPVKLDLENVGYFLTESFYKSPYFPHNRLQTVSITPEEVCKSITTETQHSVTGELRYIMSDKLWKVFWIRIVKCGGDGKNFGPYLMTN
jgi:hypothetical protein